MLAEAPCFLLPVRPPSRNTSGMQFKREQGCLSLIESTTISVDPITLLASVAAAHCLCAHLSNIWQPGILREWWITQAKTKTDVQGRNGYFKGECCGIVVWKANIFTWHVSLFSDYIYHGHFMMSYSTFVSYRSRPFKMIDSRVVESQYVSEWHWSVTFLIAGFVIKHATPCIVSCQVWLQNIVI